MSEPKITPLARRLAEENGIDWRTLKGSGPEGTVVERDILSFLAKVMAGEIDLPPAPEEKSAPAEAIPDISQAQAMLAKEGVSLSDVIPASEPMPTLSELTPPEPITPPEPVASVFAAEPVAAEPFAPEPVAARPAVAEMPVMSESPRPSFQEDKHPTLGDFEIDFDNLGLDTPSLEAEAPASGFNSEPMPAMAAEPAPPSLDVAQFPGLTPEEKLTWPEVKVPSLDLASAVAEAPHSEPAPLDLGDWGEPEVAEAAPAEPPLPSWEPTPAWETPAEPEAAPSSWDESAQLEPAWSEPTPPWQEPSPEPSVPPWQANTPAWQAEPAPAVAPSFGEESPIGEVHAEPTPSFAGMPEEPAAPEVVAPPVPEMAPAAWSGFAASGADTTPTPAAPLRVQAWQRLVQVGAAAQAAETLAQAWHREVGMLPLLYRAAEKALADLELPLRANKGVLEGEVLKTYRATPAHTLRGTLEALEAATEAGDGLAVLALNGFDQLIFPGAKVLSLGRSLGEQALLSVSGDLEAQTASKLLERVAYYLERPILLA
ncbi:MAG TPA: E3 binding domain-containing protein [Meiothermus sp.]|nr:E3 binding domain-containing protein [Meiothermus sp.]